MDYSGGWGGGSIYSNASCLGNWQMSHSRRQGMRIWREGQWSFQVEVGACR